MRRKPGTDMSFRRSLPETRCLSQGLPLVYARALVVPPKRSRLERSREMELHANDSRIELRAALPADRDAIESLLGKAGLPAREVDAHLENFLVATLHGQVLGCAGMELYGTTALLRAGPAQ